MSQADLFNSTKRRGRKPRADAPRRRQVETPEHLAWRNMMARCYRENHPAFFKYGGCGISVCERWHVFENFLADMGPRPSPELSIDRHPDRHGNYEPGNCRWANQKEQCRNTRSNRVVTIDGCEMPLVEACEKLSLPYWLVTKRLHYGWPDHLALSMPRQFGAPKPNRRFVKRG